MYILFSKMMMQHYSKLVLEEKGRRGQFQGIISGNTFYAKKISMH